MLRSAAAAVVPNRLVEVVENLPMRPAVVPAEWRSIAGIIERIWQLLARHIVASG